MKTILRVVIFLFLLAGVLLAVQASTSFAHSSLNQTSVQKIDQQKVFDAYSSCEGQRTAFAPVPGGGGAQPDSGCWQTHPNCCAWGNCSHIRFCCSYHYCSEWHLDPTGITCDNWVTGYDCYCAPQMPASNPLESNP